MLVRVQPRPGYEKEKLRGIWAFLFYCYCRIYPTTSYSKTPYLHFMNNLNTLSLPPIKIPNRINLVLQLLREEIKHYTLTNAFDKLGMDTAMYSSNIASLILSLCGVEERTDELLEWYYKKLEEYSNENLNGEKELNELAFNFYTDIMVRVKNSEYKD